jgi:hypothetical protein
VSKIVYVETPRGTKTYGQFPDAAAAAMALRLAIREGADEIVVKAPDEAHGRHYTIDEVRTLISKCTALSRLGGIGQVEGARGIIPIGTSQHFYAGRLKLTSGGLLIPG